METLSYTVIPASDPDARQWILFLHGFGGSVRMWRHQYELCDVGNLLMVELPGHGASEALGVPPAHDPYEVAERIESLLDRLAIDRVSVVSISLGSLIAGALLRRCPERIDRNLLCGAIVKMDPLAERVMLAGYRFRKILPFRILIGAFAFGMMATREQKRSRDFLIRECRKMTRTEFLRWFGIMVRYHDALSGVVGQSDAERTLCCMGADDYVFLQGVRDLTSGEGAPPLRLIAHCGHACTLQKWREFNRIAREFLTKGKLLHKNPS